MKAALEAAFFMQLSVPLTSAYEYTKIRQDYRASNYGGILYPTR